MYINEEFKEKWLAAGSSPVDWCEENYVVSSNIAEFANTISNISFVIFATAGLSNNFWSVFYKKVSVGAHVQLIMLIVTAFCSAYFHATLSLFGQFLDEIAIIWTLAFSFAAFLPNKNRPSFFRGKWAYPVSFLAAFSLTVLWFVSPFINAFVMMLVVCPILTIQYKVVSKMNNKALKIMSTSTIVVTVFSVAVWIADRAFCGFWQMLGIPGLHFLWHINSSISCYLLICTFSYLKVYEERPDMKIGIYFFPGRNWGIPYLHNKNIKG